MDGKVVVEGTPLEEGALVTVLAEEQAAQDAYQLTVDEQREISEAIAEIRSGRFLTGEEVLRRLR